jgi:hypothetical protein
MTYMRVLLCATDAGGAANLAPLVPPLREFGAEVFVITSRKLAPRFDLSRTRLMMDINPDQTAAVAENIEPAAVILGTTRYDSPDRRLPAIAVSRGVRSVAVLDECYLYRARFENASGRVEAWPDAITVWDTASRDEAVADGIPAERLWVTGSPALADLVRAIRTTDGHSPQRPSFLAAKTDRRVVTFLSETLLADYGSSPDHDGPLGPFIGYTEHSVLRTIVELLAALNLPIDLVEKRHPADDVPLPPARSVGQLHVQTVRDEPLWPLLWHSDVVVGMRSMALLEAALVGVPAMSFQPSLLGRERCTAVRFGLVPRASTTQELNQWLTDAIDHSPGEHRPPAAANTFAPPDAAQRIAALALGHHP